MSVNIRVAEETDLYSVVKCHLEAFPFFFLSLLGSKFLESFYKAFIYDDNAGLLVAVEDEHIIGFAAYAIEPGAFFSRLKYKKGVQLFFYALPALFKAPITVIKKLFRGVFYRGDQPSEIVGAALLSSICVSPDSSGKQVGSKLLAKLESRLKQNGITELYLITDLNNNASTLGFYKKNGYLEHSRFRQSDERYMLRLIKYLL